MSFETETTTKITRHNCLDHKIELKYNGVAGMYEHAWSTVWDFCLQNGMNPENEMTGLQSVIAFIEQKIKKAALESR